MPCSYSGIRNPASVPVTSFGSEPFTPFNLLYYNTFQLQDNLTKFKGNHTFTVGGSFEKYHSNNSFYPGVQSVYVYKTLQDFYTAANASLGTAASSMSA